ncbi:nucleotide exchange factor GrpE [uncultured Clostridium sp.]|uniref:nucleotide exchange factor GrpE n=1 Tax=uncultured Clostridium sp. TaxID=59620 RepID=UPI0028ED9E9D|nr:nucleotide exchange factor GrpE [uncultured Clostridium sp.]
MEKDLNVNEEANLEEETPAQAEVSEDKEFEDIVNEEDGATELQDENEKLKNELDTIKDRLLRTASEYENYRKRTAKEKEGIYSDACEDVLKEMLPVLDNLERAMAVDGSLEDFKKGIEMTLKQFKDSIDKLGIEEISTEDGFDPNLHEAVMHVQDESFGENQVVEVFLKGYKRGEKVIRYTMVKVAN